MKEVVAQTAFQDEHHFQTGEITGGVDLCAVVGEIADQLQLRQFDVVTDEERREWIPFEYQIVRPVRN